MEFGRKLSIKNLEPKFVSFTKPITSTWSDNDTCEYFYDPGPSVNKNKQYHQVNRITTIVNDESHSGVYFVMITRTIFRM